VRKVNIRITILVYKAVFPLVVLFFLFFFIWLLWLLSSHKVLSSLNRDIRNYSVASGHRRNGGFGERQEVRQTRTLTKNTVIKKKEKKT
jgi:hypothetical protein